jgi:hypothetical protein
LAGLAAESFLSEEGSTETGWQKSVVQPSNRFVRAKIASHSLEIHLCGQFHFPCAQYSIRAAIFPSVRTKFNPCGQLAVPCEPLSLLCGQKSIRAAIFRSVRAKSLVFFDLRQKMVVLRPPSSRPNPHLTPALSPPSDGAEREKRFPPLENTSDGISPTIIHQPKDAQNASLSLGRGLG